MAKDKKRISELEQQVRSLLAENKKLRALVGNTDPDPNDEGNSVLSAIGNQGLEIVAPVVDKEKSEKTEPAKKTEAPSDPVKASVEARRAFAVNSDTAMRNEALKEVEKIAADIHLPPLEVHNLKREIALADPSGVLFAVNELRSIAKRHKTRKPIWEDNLDVEPLFEALSLPSAR